MLKVLVEFVSMQIVKTCSKTKADSRSERAFVLVLVSSFSIM